MAGREVVQLYVANCTGTAGRPPKELRRFVKISLEPGEEKQVEFTLTARDLSYYNEALGDWYAAPGLYKILLGHSSRDIHATLELTYRTDRLLPLTVDENTTVGELLADPRTAPVIRSIVDQYGTALNGGNAGGDGVLSAEGALQMMEGMPLRGLVNFGGPAAAGMLPGLLDALKKAAEQSIRNLSASAAPHPGVPRLLFAWRSKREAD